MTWLKRVGRKCLLSVDQPYFTESEGVVERDRIAGFWRGGEESCRQQRTAGNRGVDILC